jgi:hypothetical protein
MTSPRFASDECAVVPPPAYAACAERQGRLVLTSARRLPDGTVVAQGERPAPREACGQSPEFLIDVVETVVDSAANPM